MLDAVERFLRTSRPCLLCVHRDTRRLADAAEELLSVHDWSRLSVGRELSAKLLPEISQRRPLVANQWLRTRITESGASPVLCTEVDMLFHPTLDLDPLGLFSHIGRLTQVMVMWPGTYQDDVLSYAVPEHAHYRVWRRPTVPIVLVE